MHYASRPVYRAHPRSRGENTARTGRRRAVRGSSPLTRGKCRAQQLVGYGERLIPAHAGKMEASRRRPRTSGAHPRSRGENEIYNFAMKQCPGSSPLTRGKYEAGMLALAWGRLIPAHAGKITSALPFVSARRAHPRSRGENPFSTSIAGRGMGSSPLTRGKSSTTENSSSATGLIPAHAGKIGRKAAAGLSCRAHPRSRGENHPLDGDKIARPGSSPLTRGKLETCVTEATELGLIPAHAGKINAGLEGGDHLGAHPRSRGENDGFVGRHGGGSGSSPLTRGK